VAGSAAGMGAGVLLAALYGLFVIRFRANQIVAGTAINMLALGLTPFLCKDPLRTWTGQTPAIPVTERFQSAPPLPWAGSWWRCAGSGSSTPGGLW